MACVWRASCSSGLMTDYICLLVYRGAGEAERYALARAADLHHGDARARGSEQK